MENNCLYSTRVVLFGADILLWTVIAYGLFFVNLF